MLLICWPDPNRENDQTGLWCEEDNEIECMTVIHWVSDIIERNVEIPIMQTSFHLCFKAILHLYPVGEPTRKEKSSSLLFCFGKNSCLWCHYFLCVYLFFTILNLIQSPSDMVEHTAKHKFQQ